MCDDVAGGSAIHHCARKCLWKNGEVRRAWFTWVLAATAFAAAASFDASVAYARPAQGDAQAEQSGGGAGAAGAPGAASAASGQPPSTSAQAPPSAERIRAAAAEYDAGRRAFLDRKYEDAAVHFENAWHDAPRAEALRNAIRARRDAKQPARAATLAALAEQAYADDTTTMVVVHDTLTATGPHLHKVTLTCAPACGVAADGRAVSLDDTTKLVFYLSPGAHDVLVSWGEEKTKQIRIDAHAGAQQELALEAPKPAPPAPVAAPAPAAAPAPVAREAPPPRHGKPLGPAVFFIGVGLTVAAGVATTVSGIDAANNPGADAVRQNCVGQGDACPDYQKGRSAQLRTNVLIGVTAGLAVVTGVVGLFFTDWASGGATPSKTSRASSGVRFVGEGVEGWF